MKRTILATIMLVALAFSSKAYDFKSGDLCYNITSSTEPYTVEVTYENSDNDYSNNYSSLTTAVIPETVENGGTVYSVTGIGDYAFSGCGGLTSVTIPNSVTSIGEFAFYGCDNLASVIFEENSKLTNIVQFAFEGCIGLTSITIPNSVTSIGMGSFYGVANINYDGSATGLPWGAIYWNKIVDGDFVYYDVEETKLVGYVGKDSVVTIPNTVTSIGANVFNNIKAIAYGGTATGSPWGASERYYAADDNFFYSDVDKTQIAKYIGQGTSITIPSSVVEIAEKSFYGCFSLDTIVLSKKQLLIIGEDAFIATDGTCGEDARWKYNILTKTITISGTGSMDKYEIDLSTFKYSRPWESFADKIENVVVEEGISNLGSFAFNGCKSIKCVSLPSTCIDYLGSTFNYCNSLQKVIMRAKTIWSINEYIFDNYDNCTLYVPVNKLDMYKNDFILGNFSKIIGFYSIAIDSNIVNGRIFVDSTEIATNGSFAITPMPDDGYVTVSVYVNNKPVEKTGTVYQVDAVSEDMLVSATFTLIDSGKCGDNVTWQYDSETRTLTISGTGDMYDYGKDKAPWNVLKNKVKIDNIVVEEGVTGIGNHAFYGVGFNNKVEIASSVKKIGAENFYYGTSNYKPIFINGTQLAIDSTAFANKGKAAIRVPVENIQQITENKIFEGFTNLKGFCTITIAEGIEHGTISAVNDCTAGEKITISVSPDKGYELDVLLAGTTPIEPTNNKYTLNVDSSIVLSATFKPIEYKITTDANNGTVTISETAHFGDTVKFVVTPDNGYKLLSIEVYESNKAIEMIDDYTFVMPANEVTVYAWFEKTDAISANAANAVNIYAHHNTVVIENAQDDVYVFDESGKMVARQNVTSDRMEVQMPSQGIYIVRIGDKSQRVFLK